MLGTRPVRCGEVAEDLVPRERPADFRERHIASVVDKFGDSSLQALPNECPSTSRKLLGIDAEITHEDSFDLPPGQLLGHGITVLENRDRNNLKDLSTEIMASIRE